MLAIEFTVTDPRNTSGFANGDVRLSGDESSVDLNSMVVLSATLLMYQIRTWLPGSARELEYNAPDSRECVRFDRKGQSITLWARGQRVGAEDTRTFLEALMSASEELYESFARGLDPEDAGRCDLERSLADFRRFLQALKQPR